MSDMVLGFLISIVTVGLKGFQHKNVNGDHYKLVLGTSIFMAFGDIAVVGLIVKNKWMLAIPLGAGAGVGMLISMWIHNHYVRKG